jgi:hypothetical protein
MNKAGISAIGVAAALVIAGASSAGTVALRPASVRIVTHTVRVTATATVTRTRTRVRVVYRPSPSPSPTPVAASVTFTCKVEQTGGASEEYEVDALGGAAYSGTVDVSFYGVAGSGDTFPSTTLAGTAPAGSASNWHQVPAADIGASAEPTGCYATAASG